MAELQSDPFVSTEPEVELDEETLRVLDERIASQAPLVSSTEARAQIDQCLTKFSTSKQR